MSMIAILTTLDSLESAQAMAGMLVERRLAACVQISRIESVYVWQGSVHNDAEFRLLAKTTTTRYAAVEAAILEHHPYDLPAVYALDIERAYGPYTEWVRQNTAETDA